MSVFQWLSARLFLPVSAQQSVLEQIVQDTSERPKEFPWFCVSHATGRRRSCATVLERLATPDKTTIVIERQPDGKMRVTSGSWDGEKVFLKDQVIEVRHAVGEARLSQNQGAG
jgi:hypothetical protein